MREILLIRIDCLELKGKIQINSRNIEMQRKIMNNQLFEKQYVANRMEKIR